MAVTRDGVPDAARQVPQGRAWAFVYTILMPVSFAGLRGLLILSLCAMMLVTGCAGKNGQQRLARYSPDALADRGQRALRAQDYGEAVQIYEAMTARYPFAPQSRQARLNIIYAYYRLGEKESAKDAAETFIRENPAHPRVDYAWYLKGLIDFERCHPLRNDGWAWTRPSVRRSVRRIPSIRSAPWWNATPRACTPPTRGSA